MPRAHVKFNAESFHYRRDAFETGLRKLGYEIVSQPCARPNAGDVLVLWNRYARDEDHARRYENAGAMVLIAENAWLGPEEKEQHHFAICRNHHNGAGTWHVGPEPRPLGVNVTPWRQAGTHILVLPQRGMGERGVAQPSNWLTTVLDGLGRVTDRPVKVHAHPGQRPHPPIDWSDTYAAVIWASGAGIKAIVAGIPVFHTFGNWIGKDAAVYGIGRLDQPFMGDRRPMLHKLSWAQWTSEEISKGTPFECLLASP
jgi:hypothetical protein